MERPLGGVRPLCTAMTDGPKTASRKSLPITCAKYEPVTGNAVPNESVQIPRMGAF